MIFSELYSTYYNTVAEIIKAAINQPLNKRELHEIIEKNAFGESILTIEPAITEERWQLICSDGSTPIKHLPTMPLTTLQKRWLKAIFADPRIKLFTDQVADLPDIEPLFRPEDIYVFDKFFDGDPYEDEKYIRNFRLVLDAIKNRYPLDIDIISRKGKLRNIILMPDYLEYSEKDDKFRLIGSGLKYDKTVNLGRIVSCKPYTGEYEINQNQQVQQEIRILEFELVDQRKSLERVLLHFAHFEKQAEKIDDKYYKVTITYDKEDETELVIRILSFGPMIKVTAPRHFVNLIKERLINQKSCE
ncbi:MAG: WYL domain-containing protein [Saccharofermentanales bacterium]|jgi:hypothetical protein